MTSSPVSGAGRVSPMVVPFGRLGEHPGWIVTTVPGTLRCVNAQIVRRTRLPADHNSPGLARVAIRGALQESGLGAVLDEALLLSTELVTNSVVHAGTDVELEIIAGNGSVTVSVLDFKAGPLFSAAAGSDVVDLAERGRGLQLVDALAAAWGTLHFADGKGVWFRLDAPGATTPVPGVHNS